MASGIGPGTATAPGHGGAVRAGKDKGQVAGSSEDLGNHHQLGNGSGTPDEECGEDKPLSSKSEGRMG